MRKLILTAAVAAAAFSAATLAPSRADAASFAPAAGLGHVADLIDVSENAQYVYRGRRHCWYPDGWHGPGWYQCGYRWRRGLGWGGPMGWQGWSYGPGPRVYAPGPRRGVVVVPPRRGPGPGPRPGPRRGPVVIVR